MAHIINTRVKSGNVLVLSGSSVEITGAVNSVNNITAPSFIGSLTGNASTVTNGVYTNTANTFTNTNTFNGGITGSITGSDAKFITITGSYAGSGAGLTGIPNGALVNSSVTIGSTTVSLGGTGTTFQGITLLSGTTISGTFFGSGAGLTNINASTVTNGVYTTTIGTLAVTSLTAGSGLSGSATVGSVTLNVGQGTGITVNADDVAVDPTYVATLGTTQTFSGAKTFTNTVTFNGGVYVSSSLVSTAYTVTSTDYVIFATGGPYTITVPSAVTNRGRQLIFKKAESSETAITLSAAAGNIDGGTFDLNGPYQSVTLVSNGTNWFIM